MGYRPLIEVSNYEVEYVVNRAFPTTTPSHCALLCESVSLDEMDFYSYGSHSEQEQEIIKNDPDMNIVHSDGSDEFDWHPAPLCRIDRSWRSVSSRCLDEYREK
jgi:hypothetical protein